jgi:hypothetical protein
MKNKCPLLKGMGRVLGIATQTKSSYTNSKVTKRKEINRG